MTKNLCFVLVILLELEVDFKARHQNQPPTSRWQIWVYRNIVTKNMGDSCEKKPDRRNNIHIKALTELYTTKTWVGIMFVGKLCDEVFRFRK